MAFYQEGNNRKSRGENTFEGGLNQGASLFALKDNESTEEYGCDTFNFPSFSTRKGRSSYGESGGASTYLLTNFSDQHLVRAVGTGLQYNSSGTAWTNIAGVFAAADWDAVNFDIGGPVLIMTNGVDTPRYWNGTTLAALTGSPPLGKYITADPSRVWMATDDVISFCAFQDPNDWTTADNAGSVQYFTFGGGDITALTNFDNLKCVWKRNAFAVIYGVSFYDFRLSEVSNAIGCISFKTVKEVRKRLFWLAEDDVYAFSGGTPIPIGQRIRAYLDSINRAHEGKCFAGTDGVRYYLGLVTGAATEPNVMCVFDTRYDIWRVYDTTLPNLRYAVLFNGRWYAGNSSGQTYLMNDGTTDDGAVISWSLTTKPFDEGAPEAEKTYLDLHLQGLFQAGTTLAVAVSTQDRNGSFVSVAYDPTSAADYGQNRNVVVPLDTVSLTYKTRFRLSGTGPVEIERLERYYRYQRVQR